MADKKGLPDLITKGIGTDISRREFGKGLTGIATEIATGPLLDSGLSAVGNISKGSSILKKIPITKELIKQYYKIESLKNKVLDNLSREKKFEISGLTENTYQGTVESKYEEIKKLTEYKNRLTRYLKITDPDKIPITYIARVNKQGNKLTDFRTPGGDYVIKKDKIKKELDDVSRRLENTLNILDDNKNKVQKKAILELLKLDNEQNEIRIIASNKKLPFNFAIQQVKNEEYDFIDDVSFGYGQLSEDPDYESDATVLNNAREEYLIDDAFENIKKFEDLENKYNIINSIEEKERIKQAILDNTFIDSKDYNIKSLDVVQNTIQRIVQDPNLPADFKEQAAEQGAEQYITNEKNRIKSLLESNTYTVYDSGLSGTYSNTYGEKDIDPTYSKDILNTVKEEILSAGKDIAKDYVKDKFITREGKPGSFTKKMADILKQFKTVKSSSTSIESDKVRAEKAKEVKEVKQQPKQDIKQQPKAKEKPIRNLGQDLLGIGKRLKYSPLGAAFYTKEVGDAELPLETSPRGYGMRRENKGRSSRDYYKSYNTQRLI
tara:strand:- start:6175 stop:7824 length:1650 start_codon:yes stop_codon:yes gene_type:complete